MCLNDWSPILLGRVGIFYDNRWIENIWKRIKYEWFTAFPTSNLNSNEISSRIEEYINYYNNIRLTKIDGLWTTPSIYASNFN
ncbi:MAG: IS3 family transposase [Ureaplasma sp.]|nr:IS3 family transposase [Ureaplasma sp.]